MFKKAQFFRESALKLDNFLTFFIRANSSNKKKIKLNFIKRRKLNFKKIKIIILEALFSVWRAVLKNSTVLVSALFSRPIWNFRLPKYLGMHWTKWIALLCIHKIFWKIWNLIEKFRNTLHFTNFDLRNEVIWFS